MVDGNFCLNTIGTDYCLSLLKQVNAKPFLIPIYAGAAPA